MDETDKKASAEGHAHDDCGHGHCHHHDMLWAHGQLGKFFVLRLLLLLLIVTFVFWAGMKFGELKSRYTGYYMMGGGDRFYGHMLRGPDGVPNMMWGYWPNYQTSTSTN